MATGRNYFEKEFRSFLYLLLLISCTVSFSPAQITHHKTNSNWYWSQPLPTGNLLYSIHFTNDMTGYAAGELGTVIKTTEGGSTWILQSSGTDYDLYEVFFINGFNGFAVGKSGMIVRTIDGGLNWTMIQNSNLSDLHDITFINKYTGYIAGLRGTILKTTNGGMNWSSLKTRSDVPLFCLSFLNESKGVAAGYNAILKTSDGGKSWNKQNINFIPAGSVTGICYIDSNTIYAAVNSPAGSFYKTINDGLNWTNSSLQLPLLFGGSVDFVRSMSFINQNTGFIITSFGTILKTTNAGMNWQRDSSFRPSYEKISVMHDIQINSQGSVNISGSGGTIIRSTDSGSNWIVKNGNKKNLKGSCFVNSKTGYAIGERGIVLKTENEGQSWTELNPFTTKFLNSVFFINENTGYTAGDSGAIYKTTNSGMNWISQTNYIKYNINSVYFINNVEGVAAGGNPENGRSFIYRTDDGGQSWYEVYDSLSLGVLNSVDFMNEWEGIAAGNNGNVLYTFNRGESWIAGNITSENLNSIDFLDGQNALITGSNGLVYKTTNGGTSWITIVTGFYLDLNSVRFFYNQFAIAAGDRGTILVTNNGGFNWTAEQKITNNKLHSVYALNDKLIAFGEYGTIICSDINKSAMAFSDNEIKDQVDFISLRNYPNPFNPLTVIYYHLPHLVSENNHVKLAVYNIQGKEIEVITDSKHKPGNYSVNFDASGVSSGIYFCSLYLNGKLRMTQRMVVLK